jgi:hypothetical protein
VFTKNDSLDYFKAHPNSGLEPELHAHTTSTQNSFCLDPLFSKRFGDIWAQF